MAPLRVLYNNIFYKTHPADDDRVTQHHRGYGSPDVRAGCAALKVRRPPWEKAVVVVNNNNNNKGLDLW